MSSVLKLTSSSAFLQKMSSRQDISDLAPGPAELYVNYILQSTTYMRAEWLEAMSTLQHQVCHILICHSAGQFTNRLAALLCYDTLITIPLEAKVIWERKITLAAFLYSMARYGMIVYSIVNTTLTCSDFHNIQVIPHLVVLRFTYIQ